MTRSQTIGDLGALLAGRLMAAVCGMVSRQ